MNVADLLTKATRQQLEQIQRATGLDRRQLEHRRLNDCAFWLKREIATALGTTVEELFNQPPVK